MARKKEHVTIRWIFSRRWNLSIRNVRAFAELLRPNGVWCNIGPLLYHYAEMEKEVSIELAWDEVRPGIEKYFSIKDVDFRDAFYTTNDRSLTQVQYHCIYFVAIRNDVPIEGMSHPVFK